MKSPVFSLTTVARACAALALAAVTTACLSNPAKQPSLKPLNDPTRANTIDHLVPARDSVGRQPETFSWTAVAGADEYSVGIWNEVDMLMWRQNHIPTNSVKPADLKLEPGTYLWTISALRGGEQIGESGLAAFVIKTE
jgi:hypothetical protein